VHTRPVYCGSLVGRFPDNLPVDLPQRIAAGDRSAEGDLVEYFTRPVFALISGRLRDAERARDLTQDVLVAVLSALRAGRLREDEALHGFVLATARNHVFTHFRERSRQPRMEEVSADLVAPPIADRLEERERLETLRKALRRLSNDEREILRLTTLERLAPEEAGAKLGITPEAVRKRKSRALKKLAEVVGNFRSHRPQRIY
jgi:RNA polymerase sigma-70 factor (ECF subfamily)